MAITITNDQLKFRESVTDPWQNLLIQANMNFNLIYPVGSIYMSTVNVDPGTIFGGTWEQLKDTFLLGAGDSYTAGDTGGEATHTLTIDEMPEHNHTVPRGQNIGTTNWGIVRFDTLNSSADNTRIAQTGGGQAHNNMPPYLVVYMWRRLTLSPTIYTPPSNVLIGDVACEDIVPIAKGGTGGMSVIVDNTYSTASTATFDKTYMVSGSGVITVFASVLSDDTSDYGTWQARIYHNGNLIMGEGTRFTTAYNYAFGASTSAPIQVSNGDTIRIYLYITKSGRKDAYRRFLCFGCTVS